MEKVKVYTKYDTVLSAILIPQIPAVPVGILLDDSFMGEYIVPEEVCLRLKTKEDGVEGVVFATYED